MIQFFNTLTSSSVPDIINPISFQTYAQDPKAYLAYGFFTRASGNEIYRICKNGTSHTTGKKLAKLVFDTSSKGVSLVDSIITVGAGENLEEGQGVNINGTVFVFATITDDAGDYTDIGYYKSTDGLTGETYGSINSLLSFVTYERYSTYGNIVAGDSSGEYFKPWFEHLSGGADPWRLNLLHTTDNGENWTNINMYDATSPQLAEHSVINLGNGKMLSLARNQSSGLWQSISSDSGATWGTFAECNLTIPLTDGQANCDMCLNYQGKIDVVFMVRNTGNMYISKNNDPDTVFNSSQGWSNAVVIASPQGNGNPHGYPAIINIDDGNSGRQSRNNYLIAFTKDNSLTTTDHIYGFGSI